MIKVKKLETATTLKAPKIKKSKNNFELIESFLLDNYEFRLNEISVEIEVKEKGGNEWLLLNTDNIHYTLYKSGFKSFQSIVQTLLKNDFTRSHFNPFKSYFNDLPKYAESEGDLIEKLSSFIEVEPQHTALFREQYKKMLVRTVACAIRVLPFNKQCLIFQGKQNDGKSTFVRYHMPELLKPYYTDNFNPESNDDIKRIAQCLIINLDEMASLSRKDINLIKSIISKDSVKLRLPYDRSDSNLPRVASFFGTTNDEEFLSDPTGSVRWMVFKTLSIKHDNGGVNGYCSVDINRVWAQAKHLLDIGYDYKLSDKDLKEIDKINRNYQITSSEQEYLQRYFEPCAVGQGEILTSTEMIDFIRAQHRDIQINPVMVGKALTFLGFEHGQKTRGKIQVKGRWVQYIEQPEPPTSFPTTPPPSPYDGNLRIEKKKQDKVLKEKNIVIKANTQTEIEDLPF